ncbi:hypothetical protein Glove_117g588 [Diversispora epigaea]|uniref:DNA-directed DNA polymerase n=1 Tax=Diversispora epigaea TaxID=1348612 RepID=A0A397J425_9GLOM|nr:hypothetical protein Glove_117g588 [Diversispora epigaea]
MAINKVYRKLPTCYNITEVKFTGDKFSRKRITHEIEKIRTRIPNKRIQVLLPYENWKPGSWFEDKEDVSLFSLLDHYDESQIPEGGEDPKTYDQFIIYITNPLVYESGCNPKKDNGLNDCFYQCLYYAYGTFSKMPKVIEKPEMLKKVLVLQRNDPIPVSFIEKVEKIVKTIAINIIGDVTILSKSKVYRKITLVLANGHYTLAKNLKRIETKSGTTKIKKPLIYQENGIKNIITLYDGKSFKTTTIPELRKLQFKSVYSEWCLISVKKSYKTEESKKLSLSIDLFRHYGSYKKVALWLFELLSKAVPANEPLNPIEVVLYGADNEWKGFGRQYDETSLYPSIMQSAFTFPIKKGKFQTLQDFINHRSYILYGIFHAKVEFKEDIKMLFRYNKHNKYTHIDLSRAKELGLQVILIQDNAPNALIYEKETRIPVEVAGIAKYFLVNFDNIGNKELGLQVILIQDNAPNALIYEKETRIPGEVMFENYVNLLFKIKNIGGVAGKVAKKVLNTLWGALCQRNKSYYDISDVGKYLRIAPFILAQGRKIISETIELYKDKVKRVHTDGFILSEDPIKVKPHAMCGITSPLINCPKDASVTLKALKFEKEETGREIRFGGAIFNRLIQDQYDYINGELVRRNNAPPRRLRSYFFNTITHRRVIGGGRRYFELVNNGWNIENDYYLVPPLVISDPDPNPDAVRRNPVTFEGLISVYEESLKKCNMTLCRECFIPITLGINEYCEEHQFN